jgi:hypothetical protein
MSDPQSAADCLLHCRDVLTDLEHRRAISLIELYAQQRHIDGIEQCRAIYIKALNAPITAVEAAPAGAILYKPVEETK